jgi:hypothetical protein
MRRRRGSAAIEFALCLPIWFLVVFAIADFGWLFLRVAILDAAAEAGCRAGSLVDPGDRDEHIAQVQEAADRRMALVAGSLVGDDCADCSVTAWTVGEPPRRTLVCRVTRDFHPLVGLFVTLDSLTSWQIARLEWQHTAAAGT